MKILIYSDTQYSMNYEKSILLPNQRTTWLEEQIKITESIFSLAEKYKVQAIIFNGDLFEERLRIDKFLYNTIWKLYYENRNLADFIFNIGNHDIFSQNKDLSIYSFNPIGTVITEVRDFTPPINSYGYANTLIRIVPNGQLTTDVSIPPVGYEYKLLFTHEDLSSLVYSNQTQPKVAFSINLLSEWTYVFNGHIHKPQEVKNVINIGSIMQQDWGEEGEDKRIILYEDGKVTSIPLDHPRFFTFDGLSEQLIKKIESNERDFFRITTSPEEIINPIFQKYNVSVKLVKSKRREFRLKESSSIEGEMRNYLELVETDLDKVRLLEAGLKIVGGS